MPSERDRGQPQARRPSLGALVEARHAVVRERDPARPRAGPASPSSEKRRSVPRSSVSSPASRRRWSAELRVLTGCQHHPQLAAATRRGTRSSHASASTERKLVQVVDHEHDRLLQRARGRPAAARPPPRPGRSAPGRPARRPSSTAPASASMTAQPEPLRVPLAALDRHPCHPVREPRRLDPRAQQHGLAAAGRRADEHHPARARARQPLEQGRPLHHPSPGDARERARPAGIPLSITRGMSGG